MKKIKIGNRLIGEEEPVFIIAEAGVNHNGNINLAKRMIDAAKKAGADAVKFQTFRAENLVRKKTEMASYQKKNIRKKQSQYNMLKNLELTEQEHKGLKEYADKKGIVFLSTPHSGNKELDFLIELGIPAIKIGSGDLTNIPFLEYASKKGLPIILSTGMSTLEEVKEAVNTIKNRNENLILLHSTSEYPTKHSDVNLRAMLTLRKTFSLHVGYSDHTTDIIVPVIATAMGAVIIEKHFTLDKNLPGPDHKASIEPDKLKEMVTNIRNTEKILGTGIKKPTKKEMEIAKIARKSIVAKQNIMRGTIITQNMLEIKRPCSGIPPKYLKKIIGKRALVDIKEDESIDWDKLGRRRKDEKGLCYN